MAKLIKIGPKWYSDFSVFLGKKRKRIHRALHRDYREALKLLGPLMEKEQCKVRSSGGTWEAFKTRLKTDIVKHKQTQYRDEFSFKMMESVFMPKTLADITPKKLRDLRDFWERIGRPKPTINRAMSSIKAAMRRAEQWNLVGEQAWQNVGRLKTPKSKNLIYTVNDFVDLLVVCKPGIWRSIAFLGFRAGLRRGEMFWLAVADLDFKNDIIHIAAKKNEKGEIIWQPKDGDDRDVPMFPDLKRYLESAPMGRIWVLGDDRPSLDVLSSYFKKLARKIDLRGGIHTLRHSCATWLAENGWSDRQIADFLGHSETNMTAGYIHTRIQALVSASKKLPALLFH